MDCLKISGTGLQRFYPDRAVSAVIQDASHSLFPEQNQDVVDVCLPWFAGQSSKLG
jgi:hypothetical protein